MQYNGYMGNYKYLNVSVRYITSVGRQYCYDVCATSQRLASIETAVGGVFAFAWWSGFKCVIYGFWYIKRQSCGTKREG